MIDFSIIKIYRRGIEENLKGIKSILEKLKMKKVPLVIYEDALNQSSEQIISNWLSQKKYCRTFSVQKALGKLYPQKHIQLSLCIDVMVNILDDLLDEPLDRKDKANYIIEFLRIFSLYEKKCPPKIHKCLEKYFEKLLTLAIAERFYQKQISQEKNIDKIAKDSADLLICRGQDIDIFLEIALLEVRNKNLSSKIKKMGRIFRALNILKKDIKDIKHDQKNKIDTVITLVFSRTDIDFSMYINKVVDLLIQKTKKTREEPVSNFKQMIEKEKKEILRFVNL